MATRKHFVTPGKDASKVEEIEWLENLAEDIQDGTYLKDLFSQGLVDWASEQIRNDFTPDLKGALEHQWELNSQANLLLTKLQSEYQDVVKVFRGDMEKLQAENTKKAEYIATLEDKLQESNRQYRDAWNTACEATNEAGVLASKLQEMEYKINALKIRVYDLEHPDK